jgi:hypothetical protein
MRILRLFRRSSPSRRSREGQSAHKTTVNQEGTISSEQRSPLQPKELHHQPPSIYLDHDHGVEEPMSIASHYASNTSVYEDRIDELCELMAEQGRCLEEVTSRSHLLSTENRKLRERLTSISSRPESSTSPARVRAPLINAINSTHKRRRDENKANEAIMRFKEENSLLIQQAELLTNELTETNQILAERDEGLAIVGKELSSCLEKVRSRKFCTQE